MKQLARTVSSRNARVVVTDNVIFVNNGGAQANGIAASGVAWDGTAEHPAPSIDSGTTLASTPERQRGTVPTVFVAGGGAPYSEMININGVSIHYASGGYGVQAYAGKFFGIGPPASILGLHPDQPVDNPAVQVNVDSYLSGGSSASFWLDGFNLKGYVNAINAHDVRIRNNSVSTVDAGGVTVVTTVPGDFFVDVSGNRMQSPGIGVNLRFGGFGSPILKSPTNVQVLVERNSIDITTNSQSGDGSGIVLLETGTGVTAHADISGNIIFGQGIFSATPIELSAFGLQIGSFAGSVPGMLFVQSGESNQVIGSPQWGNYFLDFRRNIFGGLIINGQTISFP